MTSPPAVPPDTIVAKYNLDSDDSLYVEQPPCASDRQSMGCVLESPSLNEQGARMRVAFTKLSSSALFSPAPMRLEISSDQEVFGADQIDRVLIAPHSVGTSSTGLQVIKWPASSKWHTYLDTESALQSHVMSMNANRAGVECFEGNSAADCTRYTFAHEFVAGESAKNVLGSGVDVPDNSLLVTTTIHDFAFDNKQASFLWRVLLENQQMPTTRWVGATSLKSVSTKEEVKDGDDDDTASLATAQLPVEDNLRLRLVANKEGECSIAEAGNTVGEMVFGLVPFALVDNGKGNGEVVEPVRRMSVVHNAERDQYEVLLDLPHFEKSLTFAYYVVLERVEMNPMCQQDGGKDIFDFLPWENVLVPALNMRVNTIILLSLALVLVVGGVLLGRRK